MPGKKPKTKKSMETTEALDAMKSAAESADANGSEQKQTSSDSLNGGSTSNLLSAPETHARLAVQLLGLLPESERTRLVAGTPLSHPSLDAHFSDALKRAASLLHSAAEISDEDVHAYQLFKEGGEAMSYGELEKRFKEVGWPNPCVENTLKPYARSILQQAAGLIQTKLEYYEQRISRRMGYPVSITELEHRVRRHIRTLIYRTSMCDLLPEGREISERVAQYFIHLMTANFPLGNDLTGPEEQECHHGYSTFLNYVCGGLEFSQFMGNSHHFVHLDLNRLRLVTLIFQSLVTAKKVSPEMAEQYATLLPMVHRTENIPNDLKELMQQFHQLLKGERPNIVVINEHAAAITALLLPIQEEWLLFSLEDLLEWSQVERAIASISDFPAAETNTGADQLIASLRDAMGSRNPSDSAEATRTRLVRIKGLTRQLAPLIRKSHAVLEEAIRLADRLEKIADNIENGLNPKPPSKRRTGEATKKFLDDLAPYSGSRRVRPYELFLFAAQKGILKKELVAKRSKLNVAADVAPPHPSNLSILWAHGGAEFGVESKDSVIY
jgi:hypothetical protein